MCWTGQELVLLRRVFLLLIYCRLYRICALEQKNRANNRSSRTKMHLEKNSETNPTVGFFITWACFLSAIVANGWQNCRPPPTACYTCNHSGKSYGSEECVRGGEGGGGWWWEDKKMYFPPPSRTFSSQERLFINCNGKVIFLSFLFTLLSMQRHCAKIPDKIHSLPSLLNFWQTGKRTTRSCKSVWQPAWKKLLKGTATFQPLTYLGVQAVLLHNGGSWNACTIRLCSASHYCACIQKQSTWQNGVVP